MLGFLFVLESSRELGRLCLPRASQSTRERAKVSHLIVECRVINIILSSQKFIISNLNCPTMTATYLNAKTGFNCLFKTCMRDTAIYLDQAKHARRLTIYSCMITLIRKI